MSRRTFVLNNFYRVGLANSHRLQKLAYAIRLSDLLKNSNCPRFSDRFQMYDHVFSRLGLDGLSLQYLEFGVFEGESIAYWLSKNTDPASKFYGFDSFEGLPEDWYPGMERGAFNLSGKLPDIADSRVSFVKGWFNKTLPSFVEDVRRDDSAQIVLHLDADLYSSTYYVLNCLYFKGFIDKGTVLIFDEAIVASVANTEFRAFYDFMDAMSLPYEVLAIGHFEIAIRIT